MTINNKYGSHFKNKKGYTVKIGKNHYSHCFGGNDWTVLDKNQSLDSPALLLTLDLNDPSLKMLKTAKLEELPLCTYLNCSIWEKEQVFRIIPEKREVELIHKEIINPEIAFDEDKLPNPLPKRDIYLSELNIEDYPLNEDSYWDACDSLLGGVDFIRILQPIWLQNTEVQKCSCGNQMIFTACIGYEDYDISDGFIGHSPFFIGEAALYFFFCPDCLIVKSTCQSS